MNDITTREDHPVAQGSVSELLQAAVAANMGPEQLGQLLDLQERVRATEARSEYDRAMAAFQTEAPQIEKSKGVNKRDGTLMYRYAPLDGIIRQVGHVLHRHGFSWSFDSDLEGGSHYVTCTAKHVSGHRETARIAIPPVKGQNTNAAQDLGIANTYGQRYAFCGVFGLTPTDDTDAAGFSGEDDTPITDMQASQLMDRLLACDADLEKFDAFFGVNSLRELPARRLVEAERIIAAKERARG